MKRFLATIAVVLLVLLALTSLSGHRGPRDGDTITPVLARRHVWLAGSANELTVRLRAANQDGSAPRPLDFAGIPSTVNPRATVTFFHGEQALAPVTVTLDHRC